MLELCSQNTVLTLGLLFFFRFICAFSAPPYSVGETPTEKGGAENAKNEKF